MKRYLSILIFLFLSLFLITGPSQAAQKFYWGSCLTGGGDCLDGIDGTGLSAGDGAIVVWDTGSGNVANFYIYRLYASSAAESSPLVISPDSNAGTNRWHLVTSISAALSSVAVDGSNRLSITNNTSRTPAASTNEIYPVGNVWQKAENGVALGWTQSPGALVDGHTDATNLTAAQVSNTMIYNTGQGAGDVTLNLPTAAAGYSFVAMVGTTVAANKWRVRADTNDKIYLYAADGTVTAGNDNGYVGYSTTGKYPTIGHSFGCFTFKTDAYDWICKSFSNIVLTAE